VPDVARAVTVREPGSDFPQVGLPDRFTAERTKALQPRYPAVDQNKFHGPTLDARKRAMSHWPNHLFDQLTARRKSCEAQFDDLECRNPLDASGAEYCFCRLRLTFVYRL